MDALLLTDKKDKGLKDIVDLPASEQAGGIYQVEFRELKDIRTWMFLCSHRWSTCAVHLTQGIPTKDIVEFLRTHVDKVILQKRVQCDDVYNFLLVYFPEYAGKLRRAKMTNKDIFEVVGL